MKEEKKNFENSLAIPEKENLLTRFFKWVSGIFKKDKPKQEAEAFEKTDITIPKAVKMPTTMEELSEPDKNSLEYLYKLSDQELDNLSDLYDAQLEEAKNEVQRLDSILQTYKETIKKLQGQLSEDN